MEKKDFCIIGIGRFGKTIANKLVKEGHSVMVIDQDRTKINSISGEVAFASALDAKNPESLKNVGITDLDHIVVAIGENVKDSIMTCAALRQLDLPNENTQVTAKASNDRHANVLEKLGINDIVTPENEIGTNTALRIGYRNIKKAIYLTNEIIIFQIELTNVDYQGMNLEQMVKNLKLEILITSIFREDKSILPSNDIVLQVGDIIWITSKVKNISKILENLAPFKK